MKRRIFRRIFLLYAVLMLLAVFFTEFYIAGTVRENHLDDLRKNIAVQISLIADGIDFGKTDIDVLCRQLKEKTDARVTVIRADGTVIGDSDTVSALMENHANRPEIEQALLYDTGSSVRFSDTMKYDFLYVAKRVSKDDVPAGFVRLAVPLRKIDKYVNSLKMKIIMIVLLALLASGTYSVWRIDQLRRLLHQITDFSRSLARGEIDKRLFLENAGEFTEIAENLTSMSEELQDVIWKSEEERNRLNVILKSIPDALLIIDSKGVITLSSASARQFFGDIPMTGVQFFEVVRNHEFSQLVNRVRKDHLPGMTEFRMDAPEEKYLSVRVSPLFYKEKELAGFVAVFHDITQIEKLEQVRKDFVANVSHEIKTPVTAIKGFADTLLEGALDDKENAARFIMTIKSNSERINSLVDDLMTISKIELGVIRVEKSVVDIEDVFNSILELFRDKAAGKGLSLTAVNRPGIREISADKNRLIQIFTNLVDNAIKFTESGGVTFGIDRDAEKTLLFIEDTGIGVPPRHLTRLGERFYRVDPARSRKMGGTGLGLAIVKHLVKAHGWSMQIESTPGKGTKVRINL